MSYFTRLFEKVKFRIFGKTNNCDLNIKPDPSNFGDSFPKREKVNEDLYIKKREEEKLKDIIANQRAQEIIEKKEPKPITPSKKSKINLNG